MLAAQPQHVDGCCIRTLAPSGKGCGQDSSSGLPIASGGQHTGRDPQGHVVQAAPHLHMVPAAAAAGGERVVETGKTVYVCTAQQCCSQYVG
jgi:hypothetical protein